MKKEVVDLFSKHFDNIGRELIQRQAELNTKTVFPTVTEAQFIPDPCSSIEVQRIISSLDSNKASGLDQISVKIIKAISSYVSGPISDIFNASLLQGKYPDSLKVGKITPIHKKGDHSNINNYRPVTVLSVISKILERLMFNRLYSYLESNNLLHESQFGFRTGKSTQQAIIKFLSKIYHSLDQNEIPLGILYDLSRAFDSICHPLLLEKLKSYGVTCIDWFASYIKNRPNQIVMRNKEGLEFKSQTFSSNIGVPQGSILGPLLFIIFVNDVLVDVQDVCQPVLFADDSNATVSVKSSEEIVEKVSNINERFDKWTTTNGLVLNKNKTAILIFKKEITLNANIPATNSAKFLGIEIDSDLKFENQVENVCKKIRGAIHCLQNIRDWAGMSLLLRTYHALIQSHLSYCILAWGHLPQCRVDRILRLQKWAIRIITRKSRFESCRELFKQLRIFTFPGIYIFQAVSYAFNESVTSNIKTRAETIGYNIRNNKNLTLERNNFKKCQDFIASSYSRYYNALPDEIKSIKTLSSFQSKIKNMILEIAPYTFQEFFERVRSFKV